MLRAVKRHASTDVHGASRALHRIDSFTSNPWTVAGVSCTVAATLVAIVASGFSQSLQVAFCSLASAVTVVMVFVIQHTQGREQIAVQLKLDELLRAAPRADNRFVHVESGSDDELQSLEARHVQEFATIRDNDAD